MAAKACAKCGVVNPSGGRFCTRCGASLKRARAIEPEEQWEDSEPGGVFAMGIWFLDLFPGLLRPKVLVMSILALIAAAGVGYLGFVILVLGAIITGLVISGFALVIYWTAWAWVIYGYICLPAEALADFDGKRWSAMFLTTAVPVTLYLLKISAAS